MSNRDMVIELVSKLPENTPLAEILREIEFLAGVREGVEAADRGEGKPVEEVRQMLRQWTTRSS